MPQKRSLVNQKQTSWWLDPSGKKPETISQVLNSINNRSAATPERAGSGGAQSELFPSEGYVFSSSDMLEFMNVWNGTMVLSKIVSVRGREKAIRDAMRDEFFRKNWKEGVRKIAASRFCRGHNRQGTGMRTWKATADWFLQPHVLPRVLEGKYDDSHAPSVTPADQQFTQEEF